MTVRKERAKSAAQLETDCLMAIRQRSDHTRLAAGDAALLTAAGFLTGFTSPAKKIAAGQSLFSGEVQYGWTV